MIVTERVWNVRLQITGVSTSLGVSVASYSPRRGQAGIVRPREGAASPAPPGQNRSSQLAPHSRVRLGTSLNFLEFPSL